MKVVITGANGFVAGSILALAPAGWELHGFARSPAMFTRHNYRHHQPKLESGASVLETLGRIQPDALIHTAALANIDACQEDPALAQHVNVDITLNIAAACATLGVRMIFCSTDSVFDGRRGNYLETDKPVAINVYAETKIRAESIVMSASSTNVVARLALVMGFPVIGAGNSFMNDLINKLRIGATASFPANEFRTPIDVLTVGESLMELSASSFEGIIHLAGDTCITRFDMAKMIVKKAGFDESLIVATSGVSDLKRARRSAKACLNNTLARSILHTPMIPINEAIDKILNYKNFATNGHN